MHHRPFRSILVVALLLTGVVVLGASGESDDSSSGSTKTGSGSSSHPAVDDVTIASCGYGDNEFMGPVAKLTVVNHSSKASNYMIEVTFESPDGTQQLDTATAIVNQLGPNQTAQEDASSLKSELRDTQPQVTCKVADVTRFAA